MSRIEESLYNSVSKYGVKLNEDINGEPIIYVNSRKVINQDKNEDWDAPNSCFDDLDYYGPYVPQEKYIVDIKDKSGNSISYEELCQYLLNDEEAWYELKYKKPVTEGYDSDEITYKGYGYDKIRAELEKDKLDQLYGNVLYTAKPGEGTVTKLRKEHPNYTIISRENAEKINQIDLHSINGLILDGIERFPDEVMGKLLTIINDLEIPVLAVTYDRDALDMAVISSFRFGGARIGESCDLTEAVNPENEEANAIIKKYLGKKGVPNKKEQAVLDKYGIKKDEYGGFVGPKGARIYADRTSVSGPSKPGKTSRSAWGNKYRSDSQPYGWFDKSKTGGKYKNPKDVDALDKIDYANYLTKVDPDEPRGKNKEWSVDVENEYSMKPYSEPYKDAKKDAKYERRRQQTEIDDILADEKEIERRQRSIERSRENANKHAENAAKAEQDRKDILAKARAKHNKTKIKNNQSNHYHIEHQ